MNRITLGAIGIILVIAALAWFVPRAERNPLLIDAALPGTFCDVTHSPRPPLNFKSRQWSRKADHA